MVRGDQDSPTWNTMKNNQVLVVQHSIRSFHGQATEAIFSRYAWKQRNLSTLKADLQSYGKAQTSSGSHGKTGGAPGTVHNQEVHGREDHLYHH